MDPQPGTHLRVLKTANRTEAEIGDIVRYAVTVTNGSQTPVTGISVFDQLPYGFSYVAGSTRVNGVDAADPAVSRRTLTWTVGDLAAGKACTIVYKAMLNPQSTQGNGRNSVYAQGTAAGKTVTSNRAWVEVKVEPGVFTSKGTVIGKVFIDQDGDRIQTEGEPGVANAVLYMEDGTRVVTDDEGRFSIPEVAPGTHVLRLDESSLPPGLQPVPVSNRFMGSATSQFVDMTFGGLFKANFALVRTGPAVETKPGTTPAPRPAAPAVPAVPAVPATPGSAPSPAPAQPADSADAGVTAPPAAEQPLDQQILAMSPDLDIIAPPDGAVMARNHIRILVKGGSEATIDLFVNDAKIDPKRIGRRITHPERRVAICEYVSIALDAGAANHIKAQLRDPFGNVRGTKEITVYTAGISADMKIEPEKSEIPADGASTTPVKVTLLDKDGRVVTGDRMMTVDLSAGEIVEPDADPLKPGTQVPCRDGVGVFTVKAPRDSSQAEIGIDCDGIADSAPLFYGPNLRRMIVVGSGDLTIGGSNSGAPNYLDELYDGQDARTGRGAFFAKGDIGKGFLLTAAYDSAKQKSDELTDLYRQTVNDPDYKDRYPTYGDESELGFEAQSREKLYLRVDKGKSYAMFGDYQTDLNQTTLAAYNRTFTGLVTDVATDKAKLRAFVSRTDQTLVVDTIPGRGISGLYYLTATPVPGSERVTVEVRDRFRPDRVLSRQDMTRDSDFEIDDDMRTLLFTKPVPSHDADMNPIFIIARYEAEGGTDRQNYTYGGRGAVLPFSWLELGATSVTEEKDEGDFHLSGTDATLKLPLNSTLTTEYAQTEAVFDIDNTFDLNNGTARAVDFKSEPSKKLTLAGYYRDADEFFYNPSATDVTRGNFKYGLGGAYQITDTVKIKAEHFYEEDNINNSDYRHSSVKVEKKFGKATTANVGVLHETSTQRTSTPFTYPANNPFAGTSSTTSQTGFSARPTLTTRTPFDVSEDVPESLTAVTAGVETPVLKDRLDLRLNQRQDVTGDDNNLSQGELSLRINDKNRAYVRQEYGSYGERDEWRTAAGTESEIAKKTVNYNEYRMETDETGSTHQKVVGVRNEWTVDERLSGNVAAEHLSTISGAERSGEPDALALAGGAEYKLAKATRLTLRLEYRNATDEQSVLAELGGTHKINKEYTLLGRERFFYDVFDQYGERLTSRTLLGLAYRPTRYDRFHALTKLEYRYDGEDLKTDAETPAATATTNAWIGSFEGHYQATRKLQVIGRYAGKLTLDDDINAYTDLISGRVLYDLSDRWDVGLEYRFFTNHETGEMVSGGAGELGYRVWKDLWASVGYSLDNLDSDLTGNHWGQGPYFRLRFKFDENTLRDLRTAER
ncbi:MAG: hypothetical protein A3K19_23640 [Lentisphaerae bacterium RIFOXYB12_FULL_65_16]|nr:MAG: hypothetical protein A3K19_23640 [Lentisphaerae bacterium RIFOXYB12_FULL_65_16]